jgi:hypothetical protein
MWAKYKNIIILVVVIIAGYFAYQQFSGANLSGSASLSTVQRSSNTDVLGAEIIKAINQIDSLDLDRSVFDDPIFQTLVDRSQELREQPVSRSNPFAPIGVGGASSQSTAPDTTDSQVAGE